MVNSLKWTSVNSIEIEQIEYRLEASVFNIEAKKAEQIVIENRFPKKQLIGINGFAKRAHYGGRVKRKYVSKYNSNSIGFLGSSEMLQINPKPDKYLSKLNDNIAQFRVKKHTLLISRSGTIGNITLVNDTLSQYLVSEHAIRLEECEYPGYVYSFLKSKIGQSIVKSKVYGAVVDQIEPEHLAPILLPDPPKKEKEAINSKIIQSFNLRDESNFLLNRAEKLLIHALRLPSISKIQEDYYIKNVGIKNFSVPLTLINDRLDASYHLPIINSIIDILLDNADKVMQLGDSEISKKIILPGRFKRTYVEEGEGTVFLGGKQIYELDPTNKKYLSIKHADRIEKELFLHENMIAITCSGSIGKVNIIPKHWENWTMSQHVIRVIPNSLENTGLLYIWLNSDYGKILIERYTYGSVVDEIDDHHISKVPIPILKDKAMSSEINNLALKANRLRSEAYYLEQEAIRQINENILS